MIDGPAAPLVSVIVPCVNGLPVVAECINALLRQEGAQPPEVLVVDRCGAATQTALRARFPQVQVIATEGQPSIPAMRALGIARSRGQIVAVIEDHCIVQPGWLRAIERAQKAGHRAVGGPVENGAAERLVDWAAFFCEYTRFMGPVPCATVGEIAGNNSAYDRGLFDCLERELRDEEWESAWHARWRERGVTFFSDPQMVVLHRKSFGYGEFLAQRYHYSRSFAGKRLEGAAWWQRWGYAGGALLLPGLLLWRMTAVLARKRRHGRLFVRCLPILGTFLLSWAVGESVGALLGPGQSLQRVE